MALAYNESPEQLPPAILDQHRAISSLIEELEATLWYQERAALSVDPQIKAVLEHNRDEEIEHAVMLFEILRRTFPGFDEQMRIYLFSSGPLEGLEAAAEGQAAAEKPPAGQTAAGSLNIGSLKKGV